MSGVPPNRNKIHDISKLKRRAGGIGMTGVWKKGTMQFIIKHDWDNKEERMVSKKDEPPSEFIKRILKRPAGLPRRRCGRSLSRLKPCFF